MSLVTSPEPLGRGGLGGLVGRGRWRRERGEEGGRQGEGRWRRETRGGGRKGGYSYCNCSKLGSFHVTKVQHKPRCHILSNFMRITLCRRLKKACYQNFLWLVSMLHAYVCSTHNMDDPPFQLCECRLTHTQNMENISM